MEPKEREYKKLKFGLALKRAMEDSGNELNSFRKLESASGIRHASIVEIVNGKKNPSWSTIDSILEGLELTLGEFAYYYDSITENDILEYKKKLKEKTSGQAKTPKQIKKARN